MTSKTSSTLVLLILSALQTMARGQATLDAIPSSYLGALGDKGSKTGSTVGLDELKAGAERGEARAQFDLAEKYFRGHGVTRDLGLAALWYLKSARQGHAGAQYKMFVCLNHGAGVKADKTAAFGWLQKALGQGHPRAYHSMGIIHEYGEHGQPKDPSAAVRCYERATELGDPDGTKSLAACYHMGIGVVADKQRAVQLYQKAAASGQQLAKVVLAGLHMEGIHLPFDNERAHALMKAAAEDGLSLAQFKLGLMYYQGVGSPRDFPKAASWYRKAVEAGVPDAMYNLGYCYVMGDGVQTDKAEAYALWSLAAASTPKYGVSLRRLSQGMTPAEIETGEARLVTLKAVIESKRMDYLLSGY
jgi:TPR repeat protein